MHSISRREMLGATLAGVSALSTANLVKAEDIQEELVRPENFKGEVKQSVCKWCYGGIPLEEFCVICKKMGLVGVDLVDPKDWELVGKHGLTVTMGNVPEVQIRVGINRKENHDRIVASYEKYIPMAAELNVPNVISLSGDRKGLDDQTGLQNCIEALKRVASIAEKYKVNVCLELLNSKDHDDYMADRVQWGIDLIKGVGSERVKLLFDIYHMHRMEGDVIYNIRRAYDCIGHFHTAGCPGRKDLDDQQELYYPPIIRAIKDLGFQGFIAHEFLPKDSVRSLYNAMKLCDL
ncbi:MAG: sugar phosphate isomerase/epimerase family protein [Planctomycetia bacterium]|nr:sugar phosphate isomerase/epimerase family protein [Planctomycetia bacterium]